MYAVIDVGGKQQRVQVGEVVRVESVPGGAGESVVFDSVFAVGSGDAIRLGTPLVDGARVLGTVFEQGRGEKIHIFTYKKRKNSSRKRRGHRQNFTAVKIDSIEA
jgi:large subunit ribosomal protein L21